MFQSSRLFFVGVFFCAHCASLWAQGSMSGMGNLNAASGVMQGISQGMRDADDRERETYNANLRAYQANLDFYYKCMDLQLKFKQQGSDLDMQCKKPAEPQH